MSWLTVASRRIGSHLSLAFYRPKGSRRQGRSGSEMVGGKRSAKERRIETEMQVQLVIHHFS